MPLATDTITLVEGSTFCISDPVGNIAPRAAQGLFVRDTRVVSVWRLRLADRALQVLSVQHGDPFAATFVCTAMPDGGASATSVVVVRERYVGNGMREDITVRNTSRYSLSTTVSLSVAADFADIFEVKAGRPQTASGAAARPAGDRIELIRRRGEHELGVIVRAHPEAHLHDGEISWNLDLPPRGQRTLHVEVSATRDGRTIPVHHPRGAEVAHSLPAQRMRMWRESSPQLTTADLGLAEVTRRSVEDLGALRIFDPDHPKRAVVAAGAPWYMALFGRDSLLTSWMVLPLDAGLALGTVETLAERQGRVSDQDSEEEPGRILHETRVGVAAGELALGGRNVYYGTADATPLFVMLLGELHRWGHTDRILPLLDNADRALLWITDFGDRDGDGFVEYARSSPRGLANQGWKDSDDGVNFADGRLAEVPIALAEVQGYCYAAYSARADLAVHLGDEVGAQRWTAMARELKARFNERFWLPDEGWFAVALDKDKHQVDALTSNIGHLLWTGIADADKAARVAAHLVSDEMFTGWGVRTLATSMAAYDPVSYHNGSVWPHDTALCVAGLSRYSFIDEAQRIATGLFDAASHFGHRLPELFCGFDRSEFAKPVPYPVACSPQAWAAAAPVLLLRALLGLDPDLPAARVSCDPHVPDRYLPLQLGGLRIGTNAVSIDVRRDGWDLNGLDASLTGSRSVRGH